MTQIEVFMTDSYSSGKCKFILGGVPWQPVLQRYRYKTKSMPLQKQVCKGRFVSNVSVIAQCTDNSEGLFLVLQIYHMRYIHVYFLQMAIPKYS